MSIEAPHTTVRQTVDLYRRLEAAAPLLVGGVEASEEHHLLSVTGVSMASPFRAEVGYEVCDLRDGGTVERSLSVHVDVLANALGRVDEEERDE